MVKNLKRYKRQIEREQSKIEGQKCDFFPTTFVLPVRVNFRMTDMPAGLHGITQTEHRYEFIVFTLQSEYHMFVEEFKRKPGTIWIMKPAGRAQGKGIFLFKDLKDITEWKKVRLGVFSPFLSSSLDFECLTGRNKAKRQAKRSECARSGNICCTALHRQSIAHRRQKIRLAHIYSGHVGTLTILNGLPH
jgi:hypothetical protein